MRVVLSYETGAKLREINQTEQIFICSGAKEKKLSRGKTEEESEGGWGEYGCLRLGQ